MNYIEIFTILGTAITFFGLLYTYLRNMRADIMSEFKEIRSDLKELRTGLNRLEGAFYGKDCCMLKEEKHTKKAK